MSNNTREGACTLLTCPMCGEHFIPQTQPLPLFCDDCSDAADSEPAVLN